MRPDGKAYAPISRAFVAGLWKFTVLAFIFGRTIETDRRAMGLGKVTYSKAWQFKAMIDHFETASAG
jgi:hypothetical protein